MKRVKKGGESPYIFHLMTMLVEQHYNPFLIWEGTMRAQGVFLNADNDFFHIRRLGLVTKSKATKGNVC